MAETRLALPGDSGVCQIIISMRANFAGWNQLGTSITLTSDLGMTWPVTFDGTD